MGGINMKQFNLEEYLKNPGRHIVTRKGTDAKIICTDGSNKTYPIFALIQNEEGKDVLSYTNDGLNVEGYERPFDLFFAPEKHEGWINLYKSGNGWSLGANIWQTEAGAKKWVGATGYTVTIKIEWEE